MRAISERFTDNWLIIKRYINSSVYLLYFYHLKNDSVNPSLLDLLHRWVLKIRRRTEPVAVMYPLYLQAT